jgi:cell wall-associated NlpC family hydrolase
LFAQLVRRAADNIHVPVEDVFSRVQELAALAGRVGDPSIARATAGAFAGLLDGTTQATGMEGPIGAKPDALPGMPGGTSLPLEPATYPSFSLYGGSTAGLRALAAATGELGVQEEPPGSNDGPRIAEYRAATAGAASTPGRWCAYFVSWAAAQAGSPLGEEGQGYGGVSQIHDWAERTGRLLPPGEPPRPGDLILFGSEHVGIVESVGPGDRLTTVEGNHADRVDRVERSLGEATGFVRL